MEIKLDYSAENFHRDGFAIIKDFLSERELNNVEDELNDLMTTRRGDIDVADLFYEDDGKSVRQIERISNYSPFFAKLGQDERFSTVMQQLFGQNSQGDNLSYKAKCARIGAGVPHHQDNAYYCLTPPHALTFWIALDDSNEENGCVRVVPGSHLKPPAAHQPSGDNGLSQSLVNTPVPEEEVSITLKRGDCSIHHCLTIHQSLPNTSTRSRNALLMFARSVACTVDQEGMAIYQTIRQEMYDRIAKGTSRE